MSKYKIAFIVNNMDFGGAETQLKRLLLSFKSKGMEVHLLTLYPSKAYIPEITAAGITVHEVNFSSRFFIPFRIWQIKSRLKNINPDLIHSFLFRANIIARIIKIAVPNSKLITSIRNETEGGRWVYPIYRITDFLSDRTTQVCESGAKKYIENLAVPPDKLVVLPNGLEMKSAKVVEGARQLVREELNVDKNIFIWLSVGAQRPQKNYLNLIHAFAKTTNKSNSILLIAGSPHQKEQLESVIKKYRLEKRIFLLGARTDIPKLLSAADAYIQASKWEGFPNAVLEAMAYKVPVLATKVGAIPEIIQHGKTGFTIDDIKVETISKAMDKVILMKKDKLQEIGLLGSNHVRELYDMPIVVNKWLSLYKTILEES